MGRERRYRGQRWLPSIAWVGSTLVALALALSGCAGATPANPAAVVSDAGSDSSESSAGGTVPTGFPEGFNCDAVAELIPEFTTGLHLGFRSEPEEEYDTQLGCVWYDVPLEEGQRPVDLDAKFGVSVRVDVHEDMDADVREHWCSNDIRGKNPMADEILSGHGQCGGGSFSDDDPGLAAWAPYLSMTIGVTCQNPSHACTPVVPESVTDEAGLTALRTIADHLTANFGFKELVNVSAAEDEADFVRDWGEAGFPTLDKAPDWYCRSASPDNINAYVPRFQGEGIEGEYTWEISDQVNRKPGIPEVTLTQSGGGVPGPDENDHWEESFDIAVVLGNSMRCIHDIDHPE